jgi:hypothetical protein
MNRRVAGWRQHLLKTGTAPLPDQVELDLGMRIGAGRGQGCGVVRRTRPYCLGQLFGLVEGV